MKTYNISKNENFEIQNSYLEFCNISDEIKINILKETEFENYIMSCINEELSVDWLYKFYNYSTDRNNKLILLSIAKDEYKHFLSYLELIKEFFPEKNFDNEYRNYKNIIVKYNNNFLISLNEETLDICIFRHFMNESIFTADLKYQYQNSQNLKIKIILKEIFVDESKHVALSKKINLSLDTENIEKFKKNLILEMKYILSKGMQHLDVKRYSEKLNLYGFDINNFIDQIKKSRKSKILTLGIIENLYKFGNKFKCTNNLEFENFLKENNLFSKYEALKN
ncbi:MAG: hypothetical protein EBV10_02620 [Synechococcaceae bacterium WB6_1A_059]|nr:hypothetical protein [Synechococcaceae bacterium WB6_1A_059]